MRSSLPLCTFVLVGALAPLRSFAAETPAEPPAAPPGVTFSVATTVTGLPAGANEVIVVTDLIPEAAPEPREGQQPPQGGRRGRRPPPPGPVRVSAPAQGTQPVTLKTDLPIAGRYRVRAIAITGEGPFRTVLATGKMTPISVTAEAPQTEANIALAAPTLALSPENPRSVKAGENFQLAGIVIDPGEFLDGKGRMRVWMSAGEPPARNFAGLQRSTVDATLNGENIEFTIEVTAPPEPTTLYFHFGESSPIFGVENQIAVFLALPNISAGQSALSMKVEGAAATETAATSLGAASSGAQ